MKRRGWQVIVPWRSWRAVPLVFLVLLTAVTAETAHAQSTPPGVPANAAPLVAQMAAQPDDFGAACVPLRQRGALVMANRYEMPLASLSKLLVLVEYARRVDAGLLPLDETVAVAALERYHLPRTDRGAHDRFLATYPAGVETLTLWDVATKGMIQYSSNAAADYLLDRMQPIEWGALYDVLGVYDTRPPHALTMIPLLMNNHRDGMATAERVPMLSSAQGSAYMTLYMHDALWRAEEIRYRNDLREQAGGGRAGGSVVWPAWEVQAAILQAHTATGSVLDFVNLMDSIYSDNSLLPLNVRYIAREALRWRGNGFIDQQYAEYGSKLGFYSGGTLALAAYGEPYGGEPIVSVVLLRNIPRERYGTLLREDSIGDFAHWLNTTRCAGLTTVLSSISAG